jgi:hypothetical protein
VECRRLGQRVAEGLTGSQAVVTECWGTPLAPQLMTPPQLQRLARDLLLTLEQLQVNLPPKVFIWKVCGASYIHRRNWHAVARLQCYCLGTTCNLVVVLSMGLQWELG